MDLLRIFLINQAMSGLNFAKSPEEKTAKIKRWVASRLEEVKRNDHFFLFWLTYDWRGSGVF